MIGLVCPQCGSMESNCLDSRPSPCGKRVRRRRTCAACKHRFTTHETHVRPVRPEIPDGAAVLVKVRQQWLPGVVVQQSPTKGYEVQMEHEVDVVVGVRARTLTVERRRLRLDPQHTLIVAEREADEQADEYESAGVA